jgi:tRNA G18 (ribose-2'-O)-methylase SpoU
MPVIRLTRVDDPRLEGYRNIPDAELLRRRGVFVAEGRLVVGRLLESDHRVVSLLLNEAAFRGLEPQLAALPDAVPVYVCPSGALATIVGFNLHRGCLALAERPAERAPSELLSRAEFLLVLESVTDPDNVGSAFRNAAAFGAGGVLLNAACCDPLYRKAIRTSMGSVLRMPFARLASWPADLEMLKAGGFTLVALTPGAYAVDLSSCARPQPRQRMAVLVGSEGSGLSAEAEAMADVCVRIPISADVDSLNLATASGIALHYFTDRRALITDRRT